MPPLEQLQQMGQNDTPRLEFGLGLADLEVLLDEV